MVKAAFGGGIHESAALAHEDTSQVHGPISVFGLALCIDTPRRTIGFKAVDFQFFGGVLKHPSPHGNGVEWEAAQGRVCR